VGGELAIACHDSNIRKIFEITLLDRVFRIFETPGAGVEYLRSESAPADVSSLG
jgi:anti-anti-sigma regulatory factor